MFAMCTTFLPDTVGMSYGSEEIGRGMHKRQRRKKTGIIAYLLHAEQFSGYYLI